MKTFVRFLAVLVACAGVWAGVRASGGGGSERPAREGSSLEQPAGEPKEPLPSECLPLPAERLPTPDWFPADLPMPEGSYVSHLLDDGAGARRVVWTTDASLRGFVDHVLRRWKDEGWTIGRGEAEEGEAESTFSKADVFGSFKARQVYCDRDWTEVLLVIGRSG